MATQSSWLLESGRVSLEVVENLNPPAQHLCSGRVDVSTCSVLDELVRKVAVLPLKSDCRHSPAIAQLDPMSEVRVVRDGMQLADGSEKPEVLHEEPLLDHREHQRGSPELQETCDLREVLRRQ